MEITYIYFCVGLSVVISPAFILLFSAKSVQLAEARWFQRRIIYPSTDERDPRIQNLQHGGSMLVQEPSFSVACPWFWTTGRFFYICFSAGSCGFHQQLQLEHPQDMDTPAATITVQPQDLWKQHLRPLPLHPPLCPYSDVGHGRGGFCISPGLHWIDTSVTVLAGIFFRETYRLVQLLLPASDYFPLL